MDSMVEEGFSMGVGPSKGVGTRVEVGNTVELGTRVEVGIRVEVGTRVGDVSEAQRNRLRINISWYGYKFWGTKSGGYYWV